MIKHEKVEGVPKESFMASRPVIACDSRSCGRKLAGNPGMSKDFLRERARSLDWHCDDDDGCDRCPECSAKR